MARFRDDAAVEKIRKAPKVILYGDACTAGRSQPVTPFSAAAGVLLFSRSSHLSRKVIPHPAGNGKIKIDE
jgi:hypothetical protein